VAARGALLLAQHDLFGKGGAGAGAAAGKAAGAIARATEGVVEGAAAKRLQKGLVGTAGDAASRIVVGALRTSRAGPVQQE
jgi:hypothetical protein